MEWMDEQMYMNKLDPDAQQSSQETLKINEQCSISRQIHYSQQVENLFLQISHSVTGKIMLEYLD